MKLHKDTGGRSLAPVAALIVLIIAALAGTSLWMLNWMYRKSAHSSAARSVFDSGSLMAGQLAEQPVVVGVEPDTRDWAHFSRLVRSLHHLEGGLQYVSVVRDGVTVFHEQTADTGDMPPLPPPPEIRTSPESVTIRRELIATGEGPLPVVTFTADVQGDDGKPCSVRVAIRKEAIDRQEHAPAGALAFMFKVSLATTLIAFLLCAAVVLWMMRRDFTREAHRGEAERLAFAGLLANRIAHDFRNPMSSLKLDVQMMRKEAAKGGGARPERIGELADRAGGTVDRMDRVFQEFLFLSRPASEEPVATGLGANVRDCLDLLAPRFEQTGVRIAVEQTGGEVEVFARPSEIKRAITNVLSNAEQFSPPAGVVTVRIRAERETAILEIMDQGPGIPEDAAGRLFETFFSARPGGTGLGLALARAAVENNDGSMEAENRPEGGACFRIKLPARTRTAR